MRAVSVAADSKASKAVALGERWVQIGYTCIDLFFVATGGVLIFSFRFPEVAMALWRGSVPSTGLLGEYLGFLILYGALVVLFCQGQDLYRLRETRAPIEQALAVAKAVGMATLLLTVFIYLSGNKSISRLVVGGTGVFTLITLVGWRSWERYSVSKQVASGNGMRNVLIVGAGKCGQELANYLDKNKHLGYAVRGFLDDSVSENPLILGRFGNLPQVARAQFVDEIFVSMPLEQEIVKKLVLDARLNRIEVKLIPELYEGLAWRAPIEHLGDFPVMALHREPIPVVGLLLKRLMDLTISGAGLLVISPVLAVIGLATRMDSPGPILYCSARVGKKGRRFTCYKFRTMVDDADARKEELRHLNERQGPFFKITDDPRMTRVGRFLRKYSLDELPQLWNVLKREMSLVGPRPHPLDDCQQYTLEHLRRLDVSPGITGLWQVSARSDPSFEKNMALDLEYIENWNLWLDIEILLRTIPTVLKGSGA